MKRNQVVLLLLAGWIFFGGAVSEKVYAEPVTLVDPARIIGHRIPIEIDMSASANLKREADWLAACPRYNRCHLDFVGSYIQPKNTLVGYVKGSLFLKDGILRSEGRQYFNDRTYKMPPAPTGEGDAREDNPFNPEATDKLGISIDPTTGKAKIILLSWGGGIAEVQLEYKKGIFYGFPQAGGMHAFVFKRVKTPSPE